MTLYTSSIQKDAKDLETFTPLKIPLPPAHYQQMLKCLRLPLHAVELTTFLGPLFWYRYVLLEDDDPHLRKLSPPYTHSLKALDSLRI
ncbi:hypothetical protein CABS02_05929 [Colletotrichum abscissum]|uniref:Uncharacterized protein n=1 Tax=Colletotrichum abscissum TaxID=1671311 RepID=A0A9P9XHN5_9PEZI|nr:hypothetical protein CABS02_05929 [Colletotrichum abscissum]